MEATYCIKRAHRLLCDHQSRMGGTLAAVRRSAKTGDVAVLDGCPDLVLFEGGDSQALPSAVIVGCRCSDEFGETL